MPLLPALTLSLAFALQSNAGIKVPYQKYTLPNGMKVILHVDKTLPVATINTWFYVGSKDEAERRSGFAHLYEHLMFMGTKRVPNGEFDQIMEKEGGFNNASTSTDRTNYFSFGPATLLPTLLWLDADRLEALADEMTQKKLDLQRDVVKNERRQNTENTPYGKAYDLMPGLLFPKGHPYHTSVIGSHEDLSAATVQDVKDFFYQFYIPNNATLVVAGDFDPKAIKPVIAKFFGTLPRKNDIGRKMVQPFKFESKTVTTVEAVSAKKSILAFHTPAYGKPGDLELKIAGSILSDGLASRLQSEVIAKLGLASEVSVYQDSSFLSSVLYIDATVAEGQSQPAMEAAIMKSIAKLSTNGPSMSELQRVAKKRESAIAQTLQSLDSKADRMNEYEFYFGEPDYFQKEIDAYRAMTPAKVRAALSKYVVGAPRLTLRVIPETQALPENPRDAQPSVAASPAFVSPKPTALPIAGGSVQYWSRPGVPQLALLAHFAVGSMDDPKGKEGLHAMAAELISRGANGKNAEAASAELDGLGASFSATTSAEGTTFFLETPLSNARPAVRAMVASLKAPTLSANDFDNLKEEYLAAAKQADDNPQRVAPRVGLREFLGPNHPLARPANGTVSSLDSITFPEIKLAAKRILSKLEVTYAAGGWSPQDAAPFLKLELATLPKQILKPRVPMPAVYPGSSRLVIVDRPGAVQTVVSIMLPGVAATHPDVPGLEAISTILGGSFTSRLNQNLREDKGYTYGAGSDLTTRPDLGFFTLRAAVRADVTGASLKEFLNEMQRLQPGDISAVEASKAAKLKRTENVNAYASVAGIIDQVLSLRTRGVSQSSEDRMIGSIANLNPSTINALGNYFDPKKALFVLVGDKKIILEQIKDLGLPQPEIVKP